MDQIYSAIGGTRGMTRNAKVIAAIIDDIRRIFQVINDHSRIAEKETGLTGPQLWALKIIADASPIKVSMLANRMYLHPATVVGILDRLEMKELVKRERSKEDRRVVEIVLTDNGSKLVINTSDVAQNLLVKGLEAIPSDNLMQIATGLEQVVSILGVQEAPPRLIRSSEVNLPNK